MRDLTPEQRALVDLILRDLDRADATEHEDRRARVREACGSDDAVFDEVMSLIEDFDPTEPPAANAPHPPEGKSTETLDDSAGGDAMHPSEIAGFLIRGVIDSGGMGIVYRAQQRRPRRIVALKVMREGATAKSARRRFELEAQLLARLRHPNIAAIYEAGTYVPPQSTQDHALPYFAMEYVPNAHSIIEHAKDRDLDVRERLALFAKVCDAVHHGHQKGIIHRDLKPRNILVDSEGNPKVIDFGIARSTDSDMAVTTLQTDVGHLLGTVQYMSPEQCDADPLDIDTRSDVYALGVILYELLCDRLPYDVKKMPLHEAVRVVREVEPPKPGSMNTALRGDIETITLHALNKDKTRRYASAAEFGENIRRFLDNQPIPVKPPSASYVISKFFERHRGPVTAALAFVALLVMSVVVMLILIATLIEEREKRSTILDFVKHRILDGSEVHNLDRARKWTKAIPEEPPDVAFELTWMVGRAQLTFSQRDRAAATLDAAADHEKGLPPEPRRRSEFLEDLVKASYFADREESITYADELIALRESLANSDIWTARLLKAHAYRHLDDHPTALQLYRELAPAPSDEQSLRLDYYTIFTAAHEQEISMEEAAQQFGALAKRAEREMDHEEYQEGFGLDIRSEWAAHLARAAQKVEDSEQAHDLYGEAQRIYREVVPLLRNHRPDGHRKTLDARANSARITMNAGDYESVRDRLDELAYDFERSDNFDRAFVIRLWLIECEVEQGEFETAIARARRLEPPEGVALVYSTRHRAWLALALILNGDVDDGEALLHGLPESEDATHEAIKQRALDALEIAAEESRR